MKKPYEDIVLYICVFNEDIVRTSTLDDPYDDGYQDPNLDFKG